jgi:hypothetical protein
VPVIVAATDDGPLAPDVEGGQGVDLRAAFDADDHAVLLLNRRVRAGRLHPAKLQRFAFVAVEVGVDRGHRHGLGREVQRSPGPHGPGGGGNGRTIGGHKAAGHAVIGPCPGDVMIDDADAGDLTRADGGVHLRNRRLLKLKFRRFAACGC